MIYSFQSGSVLLWSAFILGLFCFIPDMIPWKFEIDPYNIVISPQIFTSINSEVFRSSLYCGLFLALIMTMDLFVDMWWSQNCSFQKYLTNGILCGSLLLPNAFLLLVTIPFSSINSLVSLTQIRSFCSICAIHFYLLNQTKSQTNNKYLLIMSTIFYGIAAVLMCLFSHYAGNFSLFTTIIVCYFLISMVYFNLFMASMTPFIPKRKNDRISEDQISSFLYIILLGIHLVLSLLTFVFHGLNFIHNNTTSWDLFFSTMSHTLLVAMTYLINHNMERMKLMFAEKVFHSI